MRPVTVDTGTKRGQPEATVRELSPPDSRDSVPQTGGRHPGDARPQPLDTQACVTGVPRFRVGEQSGPTGGTRV